MTTIHDMTAVDLLAAYKSKKLSPVEVIDAVIKRIEAWEPKLKALYAPDFEGARKAARASEKRWQAGQPLRLVLVDSAGEWHTVGLELEVLLGW